MIILEDWVGERLPTFVKDNDEPFIGGKGFLERFLGVFGAELDAEYYTNIVDVLQIYDPRTAPAQYLDYIAYSLGDLEDYSSSETHYRNILSFMVSIYNIRGTKQSFKSILTVAKVHTTVITELTPIGTQYDNINYKHDDGTTRYDESCPPCSNYNITMTGTETLDADLWNKIKGLINIVEPINANRVVSIYNGGTITEELISVEVDGNGDLIYNNGNDPGLVLSLDAFGNLIISGPEADLYYVDDNGDLIYILIS